MSHLTGKPVQLSKPLLQVHEPASATIADDIRPLERGALQRAYRSPDALTAADVMALQRTVGNAAVQRLLASRTAAPPAPFTPVGVRLSTGLVIQPKLTVGAASDEHEQEADRVARQVAKSPTPGMHDGEGKAEPQKQQNRESAQRKAAGPQRQITPKAQLTVQRYAIVQPANYTRRARGPNPLTRQQRMREMFSSLHLDQSVDDTVVDQRTYNLTYGVDTHSEKPPLKVSENGWLAMEDAGSTGNDARVFYGDQGQVQQHSKRLKDIGSRVLLTTVPSKMINVPQDPINNVAGPRRRLVMVEPEKADPTQGKLMDANQCDAVSSRIVGGKLMALGSGGGSEYLDQYDPNSSGTLLTKTLGQTTGTSSKGAFKAKHSEIAESTPKLPDAPSKPIQRRFRRIKTACNISDWILRHLSHPDTPAYVVDQIYNLHLDKTAEDKPDHLPIIEYIKAQREIAGMREYGDLLRDRPTLPGRFGLNEEVAPEVGEAYSIMESGSLIPIVDTHGAYKGNFDFTDTSTVEQGNALGVLQSIQAAGLGLSQLTSNLFNNFKTAIPFQEHHAAVVAKDGRDNVTFENFNRDVEKRNLIARKWEQIANDFHDFNDSIQVDLVSAQNNTDLDAIGKLSVIRAAKSRELLRLKNNLTVLQGTTQVQVQTNLDTMDKHELWHFKMYGAAAQSFHNVWKESVRNPITARTTATVDAPTIRSYKQKIGQHVMQKKAGLDLPTEANKSQRLDQIASNATVLFRHAKTRVEGSKIYRQAKEMIEAV